MVPGGSAAAPTSSCRYGALPVVPPIVLEVSAGDLDLGKLQFFCSLQALQDRQAFTRHLDFDAKPGMGCLRQATFRRAPAGGGLCRPLLAPRRHFQSSARQHRRWPSEI